MPRHVSRSLLAAAAIVTIVAACATKKPDPCRASCERTLEAELASCGKASEQIRDADKVRHDKCQLAARAKRSQCDAGCPTT